MNENTYELTPVSEDPTVELKQAVDKAFSQALASVIMCEFPVASIISIFMGRKASKLVRDAEAMAEQTGANLGGKKIAAKILSKIGFIAGIVNTCGWAIVGLYLILYFAMFILLMATSH